jgi:hypothetical protein
MCDSEVFNDSEVDKREQREQVSNEVLAGEPQALSPGS